MERLVLTLVALCLCFLTGCAETPERGGLNINRVEMPEWATTGRHPDYPNSQYITAYGLDRTTASAALAAEERLEELICAYVVEQHKPLFKDTHFAEVVTEPAAWFRLEEFGSAIVEDDASNGFEAVSMRGISRNELQLRARSLLQGANEELKDTPMPPGGIGTVTKRMEMWGDYFLKTVRVVALELLASNTLNRTVFEKLEEAVLSLWELPALMKVTQQGGNQLVAMRGGAPEPLQIWGSYRGQAVTGVPLMWGPAPGYGGTVEGDREFDEHGGASARVLYLQPNGQDWGYVAASLDLDSFMGRKMGVAMTLWLWQLKLPSINNGELVLDVTEKVDGKTENVESLFVDEIKKWALARGLSTSDEEPSDGDYPYRVKLKGELDVVATTENGVPVAYASGTLTLINMANGEELFRHVLGLRKVGQQGNSEAALLLLAQKDGAAESMIEMVPRIVAALPGKSDLISKPR